MADLPLVCWPPFLYSNDSRGQAYYIGHSALNRISKIAGCDCRAVVANCPGDSFSFSFKCSIRIVS